MPLGEALDDNDDFVVRALKRDAQANKNRYVTSGLGSLLSSKPRSRDAPKPNARFLRNIVREADSHNAALKAREEEESRQRLRGLRREESGEKRKREDEGGNGNGRVEKRARGGEREGRWASALGGLAGKAARASRGRAEPSDGRPRQVEPSMRRRRDRSRERRHEARDHAHIRSSRASASRETVRKHRKALRRRSSSGSERSRSPAPTSNEKRRGSRGSSSRHEHKTPEDTHDDPDASDSDPLDSIVGPAPPPNVRPRGRGAYKPSTIDSRFAASYNPATDVSLGQDQDENEQNDWDMALEALRDRAKWRAQGAERLKAAGFTEEEVGRWEKGEDGMGGGGGGEGRERGVEDVRWRKRGEGREWDRGKVLVDEEGGGVEVRAEWAR